MLDRAADAVSRSSERLASGQRINRSSDDAAGVAIADTLRTRGRLFDVASRNINDGISAINIASATIDSQLRIVERLSELAEQAASGTYTVSQRKSLNDEYQALVREYGRVGDATVFNGLSLLRSGRGANPAALTIQTGINGQVDSTLSVTGANSGSLSGVVYASRLEGPLIVGVDGAQRALSELTDHTQGQYATFQVTDSGGQVREVFVSVTHNATSGYAMRAYTRNSDYGPDGFLSGNGFFISGQSNYLDQGGVAVSTDANGRPSASSVSIGLLFGSETRSATLTIDLTGLTLARSTTNTANTVIAGEVTGSSAIEFSGVEDVTRARAALTMTGVRREALSTLQAQYGAAQSRLASQVAGATSMRDTTLQAEGRIRDIDVAEESAALVVAQVKQQSAAQVMRLAAQQPELALMLLRS